MNQSEFETIGKALDRLSEYAVGSPSHNTDEIVEDARSSLHSLTLLFSRLRIEDSKKLETYEKIWGTLLKNTSMDEVSVDFLTDQIMDIILGLSS